MLLTNKAQSQRGRAQLLWNSARSTRKLWDCRIKSHRLRVDFLVPNQGADSDEPLYLPALRTAAEPLRFLDFLIYKPVKSVLLHGRGTAVTVPSPERFAVHKLILSRRRKSSEAKADKDLRQAAVLLQILLQKRPEDLKHVWEEAVQRGPIWRELLQGGTAQLPAPLQESLKASGLSTRITAD